MKRKAIWIAVALASLMVGCVTPYYGGYGYYRHYHGHPYYHGYYYGPHAHW